MDKKYFLDISRLTSEDWDKIRAMYAESNLELNECLYIYMNKNPGKIKVLGEMSDGIITRDEITKEG